MSLIVIDGSQGEGGGQILRSSLSLSMLTGKPFRITQIRANRAKPGLMRQHLTAVNAAATICSAQVIGAAIGSREVTFHPKSVKPGNYTFSIGSAGSTTLVLQTLLPPLLLADGPSSLTIEGGTHNIHAPPLDFLEKAFLPVINRMGPTVKVTLERAGFYPAGGGRLVAHIVPAGKLKSLDIVQRGPITHRMAVALCAGLPGEIGLRELEIVRKGLGWTDESLQIRQLPENQGPGNVFTIEIGDRQLTEVFTGFGERGVTAEAVAEDALQQAKLYLASNVPVGKYLADQLLIPFALAGAGSYLTQSLSLHTITNINVVKRFLDIEVTNERIGKNQHHLRFSPSAANSMNS